MNATLPQERAQILDVLRGFAILGIYLSNVMGFAGLGYMPNEIREQLVTAPIDFPLMGLEVVLVEGKFYSIFSLLFGIGFSMILSKNTSAGRNGLLLFYRRILILMLIGLAHILLLWDGDILLFYAIMGLFLPLFRKASNRTLIRLSILCILAPIALDIIRLLMIPDLAPVLMKKGVARDAVNGISEDPKIFYKYLFQEGAGYAEIHKWLESSFFYRFHYLINSGRPFKVFAMFLLGLYAGRNMIHTRIEEYLPLFRKMRAWGFAIGLPLGAARVYFEHVDKYKIPDHWMGLMESITYSLSVAPLALAYVSTIAILWHKNGSGSKLKVLAPVGRMALTNYLSQTIISIAIFYAIGLGIGTHVGYAVAAFIALCVFIMQVLVSRQWFTIAYFGPMEWVWRQLTYGKRIRLFK